MEAAHGNGYAPVRGLPVMMMMNPECEVLLLLMTMEQKI